MGKTARGCARFGGMVAAIAAMGAVASLAHAQSIDGGTATIAAGSSGTLQFSLGGAATGVVGTQNDITFVTGISVAVSTQGTCAVTQTTACTTDAQCPTLPPPFSGNEPCVNQNAPSCSSNVTGKSGFFGFLPSGCSGAACTGMRALVLSLTDSSQAIPVGPLYTCNVNVAAGTASMAYSLPVSNVRMANAQGQAVCGASGQSACGSTPATVNVGDTPACPNCLGDKDNSGSIESTDVVATIRCFSEDDISLNACADGSGSESCEANEVVQTINNFANDECNPFVP